MHRLNCFLCDTYRFLLKRRASLAAQMVKNLPANRRVRFDPWVRKIPWGREWQPKTLVFLCKELHVREIWLAAVHGDAKSWT